MDPNTETNMLENHEINVKYNQISIWSTTAEHIFVNGMCTLT